MTAAEILRSAQPPADDGMVEKAIADLDLKIWEWTDALKSAQAQMRNAFATRPISRPSSVLYEGVNALSAAAAAAHIPTPATQPDWSALSAAAAAAHVPTPSTPPEWTAPAPSAGVHAPASTPPPVWSGTPGGADSAWAGGAAPAATPAAFQQQSNPAANEWPVRPAQQHGGHGMGVPDQASEAGGAMAWPTANIGNWPESSPAAPAAGSQAWPTWTPSDPAGGVADGSKKSSSVRATKAPKAVRQTLPEGPTPEERARKAAAEEALLSGLEEAVARRVRLLRRLDPDTAIEKLIEKARQVHTEAASSTPAKDDKSSWWRRK